VCQGSEASWLEFDGAGQGPIAALLREVPNADPGGINVTAWPKRNGCRLSATEAATGSYTPDTAHLKAWAQSGEDENPRATTCSNGRPLTHLAFSAYSPPAESDLLPEMQIEITLNNKGEQ
jgi:hypothetical protein